MIKYFQNLLFNDLYYIQRSRKKDRSGDRDANDDSRRPLADADADFDELEDVEDFGPVLVEKIRQE